MPRSQDIYRTLVDAVKRGEGMHRWQDKTRAYLGLAFSGTYERMFARKFFRVLVVAPDLGRTRAIQRTIQTITDQIFWGTPAAELSSLGPFAGIWMRPSGSTGHFLNEAEEHNASMH